MEDMGCPISHMLSLPIDTTELQELVLYDIIMSGDVDQCIVNDDEFR